MNKVLTPEEAWAEGKRKGRAEFEKEKKMTKQELDELIAEADQADQERIALRNSLTYQELLDHVAERVAVIRDLDGIPNNIFADDNLLSLAQVQRFIAAKTRFLYNDGVWVVSVDDLLDLFDRKAVVCGDYPAPCNCDDPVTHNGH